MNSITSFSEKYAFLSNFYDATIVFEGNYYKSVEHAYQAAKTVNEEEREKIRKAHSAGLAKRLGRNVTIRSDWEDIKLSVMNGLVFQKFIIHPDLRSQLINTGDAMLIEGNWWNDRFWGQCPIGDGENHLGKILMRVRSKLKELTNEEGLGYSVKQLIDVGELTSTEPSSRS